MESTASAIGLLVMRIAVAYVFLYAAWMNSRHKASWQWTIGQTALILGFIPETSRHRAAIIAAVMGMVMMYGGGLSILVGAEGRLGGAALIVFCALGMAIHAVNRKQALELGNEIGAAAPPLVPKAQSLAWSAYGAHLAAGLKNVALIGASAYFVLHGTGRWSLSDWIGRSVFRVP